MEERKDISVAMKLEVYPNRDSLRYINHHYLPNCLVLWRDLACKTVRLSLEAQSDLEDFQMLSLHFMILG